jgi:hypothetical protein
VSECSDIPANAHAVLNYGAQCSSKPDPYNNDLRVGEIE